MPQRPLFNTTDTVPSRSLALEARKLQRHVGTLGAIWCDGSDQNKPSVMNEKDESEMNRLNFQHQLCVKLQYDNVLHTSIPKENIRRVADIGTGTGIWLEDVAAELSRSGNTQALELIGFDISDTYFAKSSTLGLQFVLSDIHKGFAEELHGTFDVVHVRLLLVVITEKQMLNAVGNVIKLLKPGGYLQWEDMDMQDSADRVHPMSSEAGLSVREEGQMVAEFFQLQGWSIHLMDSISEALEHCGVEGEVREDYTEVAYKRLDLQPELVKWHKAALCAVMVPVMLSSGKAKTLAEAAKLANEYRMKVDKMAESGVVFPMPMAALVVKKTMD